MSLPETVDFALYSNDLATWHGLSDIRHIKKKNCHWATILNLIKHIPVLNFSFYSNSTVIMSSFSNFIVTVQLS